MKRVLICSIFCLSLIKISYSQRDLPRSITILYYNTGDFFDINDDRGEYDDKYLPAGEYVWDEDRYNTKVKSVADIISSASESKQPELIGIGAVENQNILKDIFNERRLRRGDYSFYMSESDGMKTGLAVKKGILAKVTTETIGIDTNFIKQNEEFACNMLYLRGELKGPGICHIFVIQWPGIENRMRAPENLRMGAAVALRKKIDEILNFERNARIIIMGTFNDEPTNKSMMTILNASNKRKNIDPRDLYNLYYDKHNNSDTGTVLVNSAWQMWDQIVISPIMMSGSQSYFIDPLDAGIFTPDAVKEDINNLKSTYVDDEYTGGTSGHLPVYCIMRRSQNE